MIFRNHLKHLKRNCFSVLRQKQSCWHGVKSSCMNLQLFSFKPLKLFCLSYEQRLNIRKCFLIKTLLVKHVIRCAISYHLYNLNNMKNTHAGVLLLVKYYSSMNVFTFFELYKWYQIVECISLYKITDTAWKSTLSWRRFLSYRTQTFDLHIISMDWFLFELRVNVYTNKVVVHANHPHFKIWKTVTLKSTPLE